MSFNILLKIQGIKLDNYLKNGEDMGSILLLLNKLQWTGKLLSWIHTNWNSSRRNFTLYQQKTILSSKKWLEYLYAWKIRIFCPRLSAIILGCIFKHTSLQVSNFTNDIRLLLLKNLIWKTQRKFFFFVILK